MSVELLVPTITFLTCALAMQTETTKASSCSKEMGVTSDRMVLADRVASSVATEVALEVSPRGASCDLRESNDKASNSGRLAGVGKASDGGRLTPDGSLSGGQLSQASLSGIGGSEGA
ncbi:hypothetical protein GW17_00024671 [Ensete ventricosum]|nr:hypothetical protein GW17_00024671 [Ensete ventricosum]